MILQGIPQVICCLYDILITGTTQEKHLRNFEEFLKHLQKYKIYVKTSKFVFLQYSVEYLGYCINAKDLHTTSKKVEAIQDAPGPKDTAIMFLFGATSLLWEIAAKPGCIAITSQCTTAFNK